MDGSVGHVKETRAAMTVTTELGSTATFTEEYPSRLPLKARSRPGCWGIKMDLLGADASSAVLSEIRPRL